MFWNFDPTSIGFEESTWDRVTPNNKMIIKIYQLNGCDREQTLMFCEHETADQVRNVERKYRLEERPRLKLSVQDFNIPV